jgi:hypothetical protein
VLPHQVDPRVCEQFIVHWGFDYSVLCPSCEPRISLLASISLHLDANTFRACFQLPISLGLCVEPIRAVTVQHLCTSDQASCQPPTFPFFLGGSELIGAFSPLWFDPFFPTRRDLSPFKSYDHLDGFCSLCPPFPGTLHSFLIRYSSD